MELPVMRPVYYSRVSALKWCRQRPSFDGHTTGNRTVGWCRNHCIGDRSTVHRQTVHGSCFQWWVSVLLM